MEDKDDLWEQFLRTGAIRDYLRYKNNCHTKGDMNDNTERTDTQRI